MKKTIYGAAILLLLVILNSQFFTAHAQGTAFTYQGRLNDASGPANGRYNFSFSLFGTSTNGVAIVGPLPTVVADVTNGLFTATIDFGAAFSGANRWLEIGVRTNGSGAFTTLTPRQQLLPTPYAIYAGNAGNANTAASVPAAGISSGTASINITGNAATATSAAVAGLAASASSVAAGNITGVLGAAQLPASVLTNGASGVNLAGTFTGSAAGLANVNASSLNGLTSDSFWRTNGNLGANPTNGAFLGTADNLPLEIKVNGGRVLRLEPTIDAPNVVGGASINYVAAGMQGVTIAGGGSLATYGSGFSNTVESFNGTIGGGLGNWIQTNAFEATIAGGNQNKIKPNGVRAVIGGGLFNEAAGVASFIGGGELNSIDGFADHSIVAGGALNKVVGSAGPAYSTISGGFRNQTFTNTSYPVIAGGGWNTVQSGNYVSIGGGWSNAAAGGDANVVAGGFANTNNGAVSTIGGGGQNTIQPGASYSSIAGGQGNLIRNNTLAGLIGGGIQNTIQSNANFATIGGGIFNYIDVNAFESVVAGGNRNTNGLGAFRSFIGGGIYNSILNNAYESVIGGGYQNTIQPTNSHVTIGGGNQNTVQSGASFSTISGGLLNTNTGLYATIPGGYLNRATNFAFAAGFNAQANNPGAFVWSDNSSLSPFSSTANNQFAVRATGGASFVTAGAGLTVDGQAVQSGNNGGSLTNLNAANLVGSIADARLSTNVALLNANQTFSGINNLTNAANVISGNGAGLTGVPKSYFTAGSIPTIVSNNLIVFAGPTIPPLTLTAGQTVLLSTSAALGTSATSMQFDYCPAYTLNGGAVTFFVSGANYLTPIATAAGGRQIYSQSLTLTIPTTGSYVFGCGVRNTTATNLNNNDFVNVSALIFK